MILSEKIARNLSKYIVRLVRRQRPWVKVLFDKDMIFFVVEEDGSLTLRISDEVGPETAAVAKRMIARHMEKFPCNVLKVEKIN